MGCETIQNYCGSERGVLNMGDFLICHDVLKDYMFRFLTGNSESLVGFHESLSMFMASACPNLEMLNYQQWRMSWYAFLELLDIDYGCSYSCGKCGMYPEILICDATALGFKREFAQCLEIPPERSDSEKRYDGSSFEERTYIKKNKLRKTLLEYTESQIDGRKIQELKTLIKDKDNLQELLNFLETCASIFGHELTFPKTVADFMKCLASSSPVCSYFPASDVLLVCIDEIATAEFVGDCSSALLTIQKHAPIIFNALTTLKSQKLPKEWKCLFHALSKISKSTFKNPAHQLPALDNAVVQTLTYFPNWPALCARGCYEQDMKNKTRNAVCKKESKHSSLMPGLFTVYCEHAPKAIIYDNCCHLHAYCLHRDPGFFQSCTFVIDRFHWKNHTGCASSYNMSMHSRFHGINSQINEQRNAELKHLKNQLTFMNEENFLRHCRLFLWYRNLRMSRRLPSLS